MIARICDRIEQLLTEEPGDVQPILNTSLENNQRVKEGGEGLWYEGLLNELLKERRRMTKKQRLE